MKERSQIGAAAFCLFMIGVFLAAYAAAFYSPSAPVPSEGWREDAHGVEHYYRRLPPSFNPPEHTESRPSDNP